MDNTVWSNVSKVYNASNRPVYRIEEVLTGVFDVKGEKSISSEPTISHLGLLILPNLTRFNTMCLGDSKMKITEACHHLKVLKSTQE